MLSFKDFITESKLDYKAREGESEIVHHVTKTDFDHFKPLSHFGTHNAARARAGDIFHSPGTFKTISARLKLGNVVTIDDVHHHDARSLFSELVAHKHIPRHEISNIEDDIYTHEDEERALVRHLRRIGINTIKYQNDFEDPGSTSYIITHPNQVRIIHKGIDARVNTKRGDKYR